MLKKKKTCGTKRCSSKTQKKTTKAASKKVKFSLNAPDASKVMLVGDFNNWKQTTPLKKSKSTWVKDLSLKPGKYEYKFVVDGNWVNDPNNNCTVWNTFGTQNSVIEI